MQLCYSELVEKREKQTGEKKKQKTCNFIQILEETSTRLSTLYELPLLKLVHIFLV